MNDEEAHFADAFRRLSASGFRSRFRLSQKDRLTAELKGEAVIEAHARAIVAGRLAPGEIPNDGRQTPFRGHPVFTAQHATACCCRQCFSKWRHVPAGLPLSEKEAEWAVGLITRWISRELLRPEDPVRPRRPKRGESGSLF